MPLSTNLSAAPYFDDFDQSDDYYRILFKPATAVQVREVNQLQTILQHQIEQFGDHILRSGTIIDGCEFEFKNTMPYIKILDTTIGGAAVDPQSLNGLFLQGTQSLKEAIVEHVENGFESDSVNLKTLYVKYTDDDNVTQEDETFRPGEILKVISKEDPVWAYNVSAGGNVTAFSNADAIAVLSAIEVVEESEDLEFSNTFTEGERLVDSSNTISVLLTDDTDFETDTDEGTKILRIKPDPAYQHGGQIDTATWTIPDGTILTSDGGNVMKVVRSIGTGATATVKTTATGQIDKIEFASGGTGYTTPPHVSIYSIGANQSQVANLLITPQMFKERITVADETNFPGSVGVGYGMSIAEGKIYQKGLFLNVGRQFTMVSKYSNTPDAVSVGFDSVESVVNVFTDSTLYDNASGFLNYSAPGADRLQLRPTLIVRTEAEETGTDNYFPVVRFAEGKPYQQTKETSYNKLGDMIAQRTYEESGNYVLDPFAAITNSTQDFVDTATKFMYVVDPGHAYIGGYRITTETNFAKEVDKSLETITETDQGFDLGYGSFLLVNEVAGLHSFKNGQTVSLRATAANFITTQAGEPVTSTAGGTEIGTARIRMFSYYEGKTGTPSATYKLYLFDVQMIPGAKVQSIRSIYSPSDGGSADGIADVVLVPGDRRFLQVSKPFLSDLDQLPGGSPLPPLPYVNEAQIEQPNIRSLVYDMGRPAKSVTNFKYRYRSSTDGQYATAAGILSISAEGGSNTSFPYVANLSESEENDIILIPSANIEATTATYSNVQFYAVANSRTVSVSSMVANETVDLTVDFKVGDYIQDIDGNIGYIRDIDGTNKMRVHSANTSALFFSSTGSGAQSISRFFPGDVPINLFGRTDMYANVSGDGQSMSIYLGIGIDNTAPFSVIYDQEVDSERCNLVATRNCLVQVTGDDGVWPKSLGLPNVIRLRGVYNGSSTGDEDITSHFVVNSNQNESYYGLSELQYLSRSGVTVNFASTITVEVDILEEQSGHGAKIINSYDLDDTSTVDQLTGSNTAVHTMEIPEFVSSTGQYYDLRDCIDFRPMALPTANVTSDINCVTVNPANTVSFAGSQLRIPKPMSDYTYTIEYYKPRRDQISVKYDGSFEVSTDSYELQPKENVDKLPIYDSIVAPYPSLPEVLSEDMKNIIATRIISGVDVGGREQKYTNQLVKIQDLPRVYTMNEIAGLEQRIRALEYNQNLSMLENSTQGRTIQSSIDSTLERFKFGFFVDNFESDAYSQLGDPNYAASIYEYVLQPAKGTLNLEFEVASASNRLIDGNKIVFPYRRRRLLSQNIATYAKFIPEPPLPEIKEQCDFIVSRNNKFVGQNVARYTTLEAVWEEFTFFAADDTDGVVREVEIKFFNPVGNISYEVIQSKRAPTAKKAETGTRVWSPTRAPGSLSTGEAVELYNKSYGVRNSKGQIYPQSVNPWFDDRGAGNPLNIYEDPEGQTPATGTTAYATYQGAGKISFKYNHLNGRYLTVRVHKGAPHFSFEICYPAITIQDEITDSGQSTFKDPPAPPPPCKKGTFKYAECRGNDRYTIVCNGLGGTMVGSISKNDRRCRTTPPPCFYAGTLVNMADGTMKTIEDIQVGDQVMAMNGQTDTVSYVHDIPVADRVLYTLNGLITATDAHPFLTTEGWKSANPEASKPIYESYGIEIGQLKVGDKLIGIDGEVELTSLESREENTKVYNFTTASTHTYVVEGLVTHNKTQPPPSCPPAGTFYRRECTTNHTLRVWEYTGKFRGYGSGGGGYSSIADCAVRVALTDLNNSQHCGYTPPDDGPDDCPEGTGPGYGTVPSNSGSGGDDGCIPNVDPHCPIEGGGTPPTTGGGSSGPPSGYGTVPSGGTTPPDTGSTGPSTTGGSTPPGGSYGTTPQNAGGFGSGNPYKTEPDLWVPSSIIGGGISISWPPFGGTTNVNINNSGPPTTTGGTPPSSTSTAPPTSTAPTGRPPSRGGSGPGRYPGRGPGRGRGSRR